MEKENLINDKKYYSCNKCGQSVCKGTFEGGMYVMCVEPAFYRGSGICGGSISIEISKEEYDNIIEEWRIKREGKNKTKDNA